jgi:hypothetical protein
MTTVPCSSILVSLMMEAIRSSEASDLTRATWRRVSAHGIFYVMQKLKEKILEQKKTTIS